MDRILIALDVSSADDALRLADRLRGTVGGYKIGSQLFTAAGPDVVRSLVRNGDRVFLDLKFHDIPNTVAGAVTSACELGVWMMNVHASGGEKMMRAAREAADLTADANLVRPLLIAVTVLTSMDAPTLRSIGVESTPMEQVVRLARMVKTAGLDGVVASPLETEAIRDACGPDFLIVTPGIRGGAAGTGLDDQSRTSTPAGAIAAGSSYLVIGRPITAALDPREAAIKIGEEIGSGPGR
ncbi:MAG TPA: orotidine-5'-phosphate decarboxylase [Vicinamibacterales bacterium]|nr:orotidine-5'-phosphate decarboxylase [Vicinamibacterales bacterium]